MRYSLVPVTVRKGDRTFVESEAERHVSLVRGGYKCKLYNSYVLVPVSIETGIDIILLPRSFSLSFFLSFFLFFFLSLLPVSSPLGIFFPFASWTNQIVIYYIFFSFSFPFFFSLSPHSLSLSHSLSHSSFYSPPPSHFLVSTLCKVVRDCNRAGLEQMNEAQD